MNIDITLENVEYDSYGDDSVDNIYNDFISLQNSWLCSTHYYFIRYIDKHGKLQFKKVIGGLDDAYLECQWLEENGCILLKRENLL